MTPAPIVSTVARDLGIRPSRLPSCAWNLWNKFVSTVRTSPELFLPLMVVRMKLPNAPQWQLVGKDTELVIEGYWRSGNTFAARAFESAQFRPVRMAFHTHALATVRVGVRLERPVLILARPPLEAVVGRLFLAPHLTPDHALRDYVRFYRGIVPFRAAVVRATFEEIVADYGAVIERVNARFGTAFRLPGRAGHSLREIGTCRTLDLPHLASVPHERIIEARERIKWQMQRCSLIKAARRAYRDFCK